MTERHRRMTRAPVHLALIAALVLTLSGCLPAGGADTVAVTPPLLDGDRAQSADSSVHASPSPQPAAAPRVPDATAEPATENAHSDGSPHERGAAALAALGYDLDALGWTISFSPGRPGLLGVAHSGQRHIEIFVRPDESESLLRSVIGHEIGHAVDLTYGDDDRRARWRHLRRIPADRVWFGCSLCEDNATPAGDFAEVFSMWLAGPEHFRSALAGRPSAAELVELSALFQPPAGFGAWHGGMPTPEPPSHTTPEPEPTSSQPPPPSSPPPSPSPSGGPTVPCVPVVVGCD